jgi:putative transposase
MHHPNDVMIANSATRALQAIRIPPIASDFTTATRRRSASLLLVIFCSKSAAMPRRSRVSTSQFVFHVLNRAIQGVTLFEHPTDYEAFLETLTEARRRLPMRLLSYSVMPNHWHLVLWPLEDGSLSPFMRWLTAAHARQWRDASGTRGRGAVYQGRFKAIAVQHDGHFLRLCRYVERNPVRAKLAAYAADWPWSSASLLASGANRPVLTPWPVGRPDNWTDLLDTPEPTRSLREIRTAVRASLHYGSAAWRLKTSQTLRWRNGVRQPGKPVAYDPAWVS